jgi:putative flippase GtrA
MRKLALRLLGDERVRFVIIGGVNTVLGYGLFALFDLTLGKTIGYLGALYAAYVIAIVVAFFLHRRFTFRAHESGNPFVDFLRFSLVYVVSLLINTAALPLLVELARMPPLVAQAVIVVVTTLVSYFGHKFFSFRRAPEKSDDVVGQHDH